MTQFPDPHGERLEGKQLQVELHQILVCRVASAVVSCFASSRRRSMFLLRLSPVPAHEASRATGPPRPNTFGPASASAATSTDESTTTLNAGQRRGSAVSAWRRRGSASPASLAHLLQPGIYRGTGSEASSSARRNSCIDLPARAARAASSSRTFSGTSRW